VRPVCSYCTDCLSRSNWWQWRTKKPTVYAITVALLKVKTSRSIKHFVTYSPRITLYIEINSTFMVEMVSPLNVAIFQLTEQRKYDLLCEISCNYCNKYSMSHNKWQALYLDIWSEHSSTAVLVWWREEAQQTQQTMCTQHQTV